MSHDSAAPIPLGLVGLNFGRWIVLDHLLKGPGTPYFRLAALCDGDANRLGKMREDLGSRFNGKAYTSLDAMLEDPEIRVVGLFTSPVGRAQLIRKIIRSGRDVITTKPFELDPQAGLEILREAQSLGRTVVLNSPGPILPEGPAKIVEWQHTFNLGRPVAARAEATVAYAEKADGTWYDQPALCPVAPIFRIGIYLINDVCAFFNEPERVFVQSSRIHTGRPTPDHAQAGIRFRDGSLVNIFASFCIDDGDAYRNSLILNFERGTVYREVGPERNSATRLSIVGRDKKGARTILDSCEIVEPAGSYDWKTFHDLITGKPVPGLLTPEQICTGLRIIRALGQAEQGEGWADVTG